MDQAIGSKIADYLIKPVNPNQILLSIKKHLHGDRLVSQQQSYDYQREFQQISMQINDCVSLDDWKELYRKLVFWELQLAASDTEMASLLEMQKGEANSAFSKMVKRRYHEFITAEGDKRPLLSPDIFKKRVFPLLDAGERVYFILIDNLRLDQWAVLRPMLADLFHIEEELYTSILPTATQYARNAIFSGLMPIQIQKLFPELWVDEDEEGSKNVNEAPLIDTQLKRYRRPEKFSYNKVNDSIGAERLLREVASMDNYPLNVIVINFIDMLSHARTESRMIRELASNNAAYRSITESWLRHSPTLDLFRRIASRGGKVIVTTDHGTIRVTNPVRVVGDRNTNTNLRYKVGKNLDYPLKQVYEIKQPQQYGLPSPNVSSTYIFATGSDFFAYPNNYNHYVQYYEGTFQHGGISLEEMLVPLATLTPR